ncbi:hypothetical protein RHSIM_RhsimUnG0162000 [Rhododendron simsii]|uniref:Insecticidal crystal toxin domain-containing protein n=1 Tax=Rhododendron simsii TaxID=118357 RepID=A0A834L4F6_RHOSS|nr:hypothetical protein RHSIM_RhsimUnG0162000 [Rhododendron simsii]
MYVTRPLSHYLRSPESLSLPPEGPNSGYLVILDEESERTTFFGLCKNRYLKDLPFPQNKNLTVRYSSGVGKNQHVSYDDATFIPVLNQPLSSNRYYAIKPRGSRKGFQFLAQQLFDLCPLMDANWVVAVGKMEFNSPGKMVETCGGLGGSMFLEFKGHAGKMEFFGDVSLSSTAFPHLEALSLVDNLEAYACSREEDMAPCCFCNCINDVYPRPLNPDDIYQQFVIFPKKRGWGSDGAFSAKSVAPDGFPPHFLRRSGWEVYTKTPKTFELGEAPGINATLRASLPNFDFPVVVGKWYCPFMFVKDGNLKDQMKRSLFYEMTLEQRWEKIFACENNFSSKGNSVSVEAEVQREVVFVDGREAVWDEKRVGDGVVWFRGSGGVEQVNMGLSSLIVDRMKWEEERGGWVREEKRQVKVNRTEEFGGIGGVWSKFGCYVLVERFVLKRMDGSVVLTYDFKHTHVIRSKWE